MVSSGVRCRSCLPVPSFCRVSGAAMPGLEPHRLVLPTATGGFARLAAKEARAAGIDLEPFLAASRFPAAQIQHTDERVGVKEQIAFVDALARALGRARFGFDLAREFDLRTIGLLYYVGGLVGYAGAGHSAHRAL